MAGIEGSATPQKTEKHKSQIGNQFARKWTEEELIERFENALQETETDYNALCIQDFYFKTGIPVSTCKAKINEYQVLANIKESAQSIIISRINKKALNGEYNSTASIWRFKQLGERDERYQDVTTQGEKIESPKIDLSQLTYEQICELAKGNTEGSAEGEG